MIGKRARPALPFIFVTVFVDVLGIGIALPVLPALVGEIDGQSRAAIVLVRRARHHLRADAVRLRAGPGRPVRPLRPAPAAALVAARAGHAFLAARDCADASADAGGAGPRRRCRRELRGRQRLRGRRDAAGAAGEGIRHPRRRVRARIHLRADGRRTAGRGRPAPAVLRGRRALAAERDVRLPRRSGIAAARAAREVLAREGQSAGRAARADAAPRRRRARLGRRARRAGAADAAGELGALHDLPLRLGTARQRLGAVHRRRRRRRRAGRADGAAVAALRRGAACLRRARDGDRRVPMLRTGHRGLGHVHDHRRELSLVRRRPGAAGADLEGGRTRRSRVCRWPR